MPRTKRDQSKRRALLTNSWVLLLAAGMLAITIVSVDRLHVSEPLQDGKAQRHYCMRTSCLHASLTLFKSTPCSVQTSAEAAARAQAASSGCSVRF